MLRKNFSARKEKRQEEAKYRQSKHDELSLDNKLSKAGKKETAKLLKKQSA
jgi:hypothetical protein